jgi:hypothetical protein
MTRRQRLRKSIGYSTAISEGQIAVMLNQCGLRSGEGKPFHGRLVARIRRTQGLKPRYDRLREAGMYTVDEKATLLGTCTATVKQWGHHGLLQRHLYSDKNECLYAPPGDIPPTKCQGTKLSDRHRFPAVLPNSQEVQCEACCPDSATSAAAGSRWFHCPEPAAEIAASILYLIDDL